MLLSAIKVLASSVEYRIDHTLPTLPTLLRTPLYQDRGLPKCSPYDEGIHQVKNIETFNISDDHLPLNTSVAILTANNQFAFPGFIEAVSAMGKYLVFLAYVL
jgi:hypothetical protein